MIFSSIFFVFAYLPIVLILYYLVPYRLFKNAFCAAAARSPTMKKI